jgi:hypothetical protein
LADSIYKWSLTAASNDAADSIINWRENQLPDTVNDSARAMMQRVAEFREDVTGNLITAGTQPAYTLTTKAAFDTLTDGRRVTTRIHATNAAGAATLNVNALGAKAIRKFGTGGDLAIGAGDLQLGGLYSFYYSTIANAGAGAWVISNPSIGTGGGFASGTQTLFFNATAPIGWTKQTTHNDKALRIVSGTGGASAGTVAFTTAFNAARTVTGNTDDFVLTATHIPPHTHTQQGSFGSGGVSANHTHTQQGTFGSGGRTAAHNHNVTSWVGIPNSNYVMGLGYGNQSGQENRYSVGTESADHAHNTTISGQTGYISSDHSHTTTISGQTGSIGGGGGHGHAYTLNAPDIQYVDALICQKD